MTVHQVLMEMSNITVSKLNGRRLPKRAGSKSGCVSDGSKATKPQSTHAHDTHVVGLCPEPLVMPGARARRCVAREAPRPRGCENGPDALPEEAVVVADRGESRATRVEDLSRGTRRVVRAW